MFSAKDLKIYSLGTLFLACVLAYYARSRTSRTDPVVNTQNGKVHGQIALSREGREFYEFLGV